MSTKQNDVWKEAQYEDRQVWLKENLSKEEDVKKDDNGEYIVHVEYDGSEMSGAPEKIYLPVELNMEVITNLSY